MSHPHSHASSNWTFHLNKPWTSLLSIAPLQRFRHRSTPLLISFIIFFLTLEHLPNHCIAAPVAIHLGSPSSASASTNTKILIWPDEIEDNALAEQNGDFIMKKATAAEKQEQKSSSSIFFWPSSHGGSHHHSRSSRNSAYLSIASLDILLLCLTVSWILVKL